MALPERNPRTQVGVLLGDARQQAREHIDTEAATITARDVLSLRLKWTQISGGGGHRQGSRGWKGQPLVGMEGERGRRAKGRGRAEGRRWWHYAKCLFTRPDPHWHGALATTRPPQRGTVPAAASLPYLTLVHHLTLCQL